MVTHLVGEGEAIDVLVGCQSLISNFESGSECAGSHNKMHAGMWRQLDLSKIKDIQKVKAHQDEEVAAREGWMRQWQLNDQADKKAKFMTSARGR